MMDEEDYQRRLEDGSYKGEKEAKEKEVKRTW